MGDGTGRILRRRMTGEDQCRQCGVPIGTSVPEGLCPACLSAFSLQLPRPTPRPDNLPADQIGASSTGEAPRVRIADYELEAEIARGGVGVVYRARQVSLNRLVALKLLLSGQFADADQVKRFRAEAEAVARLDHSGIVPVYEVGEFEGRHFFSMKLIVGRSLAGAMKDFGLSAAGRRAEREGQSVTGRVRVRQRELAGFLAKIARAIHYAHQRGILHRDLKPANILLDEVNEPHVTDFGLARFVGDERKMTRTGSVFGTPAYMPPEQTDNPHNVTVAADVYSLGAIGYELMTGQPPFEAGSPFETVIQLREKDPVAPREIEGEIERDLETILLKCLSKDPARRYESALAFAEDLDRFVAGEPIQARPVFLPERVWRWAQRHPAVAALSVVVVALVLGVAIVAPVVALRLSFERNRAEDATQRAREELRGAKLARARAERLGGEVNHRDSGLKAVAEAARLGPDRILLDEAIAQLVRFDATADSLRPRAGPGLPVAMMPDFSAYLIAQTNGVVQGFNATNDALLWSWTGTRSNRVDDLYVSPGGHHLLVSRAGWLELVRLPDPHGVAEISIIDFFGFSADGNWFLTMDRERKVERYETATGRLLGTLPFAATWQGEVAVSPDPTLPWVAVARGHRVELFDWEKNRVIDTFEHFAPLQDIEWSGDWLAAGDTSGNIPVWHLPSRRGLVLTGHRTVSRALHFVPGTTLLLSTVLDGQTYCWDVASGERLLTSDRVRPLQVSQDGRKLLYGTLDSWGWADLQQPRARLRVSCLDTGDNNVREVQFREDGRWLLVVKQAGVHLVDRVRGVHAGFEPAMGTVRAAFVPGTNQFVLQRRSELRWHSFDPGTGHIDPDPVRRHVPTEGPWLDVGRWSADGTTLILPMLGGVIEFLRLNDGVVLRREARPELESATELDVFGDQVAFLAEAARRVERLDLGTHHSAERLLDASATPWFSPNGHWLLLSGRTSQRVVRVSDWRPVMDESIAGRHSGRIAPGAWAPDSAFLALVVDRTRIGIFRAGQWQPVAFLTTPQSSAFSALSFSAGCRWLAAGTDQGSVELWDLSELKSEVEALGLRLDWPVARQEEGMPATVIDPSPTVSKEVLALVAGTQGLPPRPSGATARQLDLSPYYNSPFAANRRVPELNAGHLEQLKPGLLAADGIVFDVRGIVQLNGGRLRQFRPDFPVAVTNVSVGGFCRRVHLLGAVAHGPRSVIRPLEVARLRLHYADGGHREVPIRLGQEIEDCWNHVRTPLIPERASIGWRDVSSLSEADGCWVQLTHLSLANPRPQVEVTSLDLVSTMAIPSPFFVGITIE